MDPLMQKETLEKEKSIEKERPAFNKLNMPSVICSTCDIQGNVTFGKGCIVHPGCSILAEGGEIIIGDFNIIEERVVILNKGPKDKSNYIPKPLKIGNFNIFEVGTIIENSDVGDCNMFEHKGKHRENYNFNSSKAHVESGCQVKNGCTLGAGVRIPGRTVIDNNKAVFYPGRMVENSTFNEDNHKYSVFGLIELLAKMIPKHSNLKK